MAAESAAGHERSAVGVRASEWVVAAGAGGAAGAASGPRPGCGGAAGAAAFNAESCAGACLASLLLGYCAVSRPEEPDRRVCSCGSRNSANASADNLPALHSASSRLCARGIALDERFVVVDDRADGLEQRVGRIRRRERLADGRFLRYRIGEERFNRRRGRCGRNGGDAAHSARGSSPSSPKGQAPACRRSRTGQARFISTAHPLLRNSPCRRAPRAPYRPRQARRALPFPSCRRVERRG